MQDVDGNHHQALQWLVEYGNPVMMLGRNRLLLNKCVQQLR